LTQIIIKYRFLIIILGLIILTALLWLLMLKNDMEKIPSRGVFVMKNLEYISVEKMEMAV
jgi:lipopolysaccharide export system protein LptC